jgi:hypothetical protein
MIMSYEKFGSAIVQGRMGTITVVWSIILVESIPLLSQATGVSVVVVVYSYCITLARV